MAILGRFNGHGSSTLFKDKEIKISDYIVPELITFFDVGERNEALQRLVSLLFVEKKIQDKKLFFKAILQREEIVSTGIGMEVAIPHAKLNEFDDFFIAIGIQKKGVDGIEWDALDGCPVRIVFMIGGPDDQQTEYLNILSRLTTVIKDEERRHQLLECQNGEDVLKIFADC